MNYVHWRFVAIVSVLAIVLAQASDAWSNSTPNLRGYLVLRTPDLNSDYDGTPIVLDYHGDPQVLLSYMSAFPSWVELFNDEGRALAVRIDVEARAAYRIEIGPKTEVVTPKTRQVVAPTTAGALTDADGIVTVSLIAPIGRGWHSLQFSLPSMITTQNGADLIEVYLSADPKLRAVTTTLCGDHGVVATVQLSRGIRPSMCRVVGLLQGAACTPSFPDAEVVESVRFNCHDNGLVLPAAVRFELTCGGETIQRAISIPRNWLAARSQAEEVTCVREVTVFEP